MEKVVSWLFLVLNFANFDLPVSKNRVLVEEEEKSIAGHRYAALYFFLRFPTQQNLWTMCYSSLTRSYSAEHFVRIASTCIFLLVCWNNSYSCLKFSCGWKLLKWLYFRGDFKRYVRAEFLILALRRRGWGGCLCCEMERTCNNMNGWRLVKNRYSKVFLTLPNFVFFALQYRSTGSDFGTYFVHWNTMFLSSPPIVLHRIPIVLEIYSRALEHEAGCEAKGSVLRIQYFLFVWTTSICVPCQTSAMKL